MLLHALTFELRIMLRKRRRKVEEHKANIKRRLTVILPAQEAKGGQPLAPILGQVQINTNEFVTLFNSRSSIFESGFPTYIEILINWEKGYEIEFLSFPFTFFIDLYVFLLPDNLKYISFSDLLQLISIYKYMYSQSVVNDDKVLTQILSILKTHNISIVVLDYTSIIKKIYSIFSIIKYYKVYKIFLCKLTCYFLLKTIYKRKKKKEKLKIKKKDGISNSTNKKKIQKKTRIINKNNSI